jgi:hypothetical protein
MIAPTDDDYRDAKRVKTHGAPLPPPFKELAEWIAARYDVHVLNIILDTIEPDNRPRLNVILEWAGEERKFMEDSFPNFDGAKQREIRDKFASLSGDPVTIKINMARLLVVFSSFEPVARTEANWRVTDHEIEQLKKTRQLEREPAELHGVDDCVVFVSGHATNVSTIGCLFGPKDLVVHDALIHNSAMLGIQLCGARRMGFRLNSSTLLTLVASHANGFRSPRGLHTTARLQDRACRNARRCDEDPHRGSSSRECRQCRLDRFHCAASRRREALRAHRFRRHQSQESTGGRWRDSRTHRGCVGPRS